MGRNKIRSSQWLDPDLWLMAKKAGINFSATLDTSLRILLDMPVNPIQDLLVQHSKELELRLRARLAAEVRVVADQEIRENNERALRELSEHDINKSFETFGKTLQKLSCYSQVLEVLEDQDAESSIWSVALEQINNLNGNTWTFEKLWNTSIEWYKWQKKAAMTR